MNRGISNTDEALANARKYFIQLKAEKKGLTKSSRNKKTNEGFQNAAQFYTNHLEAKAKAPITKAGTSKNSSRKQKPDEGFQNAKQFYKNQLEPKAKVATSTKVALTISGRKKKMDEAFQPVEQFYKDEAAPMKAIAHSNLVLEKSYPYPSPTLNGKAGNGGVDNRLHRSKTSVWFPSGSVKMPMKRGERGEILHSIIGTLAAVVFFVILENCYTLLFQSAFNVLNWNVCWTMLKAAAIAAAGIVCGRGFGRSSTPLDG
jgi:hypothetical protein